jgi:hypothetical protein
MDIIFAQDMRVEFHVFGASEPDHIDFRAGDTFYAAEDGAHGETDDGWVIEPEGGRGVLVLPLTGWNAFDRSGRMVLTRPDVW